MANDNQNKNIAKMLEAAASDVKNGRCGDLTLMDSVVVTAATNYKTVTIKKNSVTRTTPSNKTVIGNKYFWNR